MITVAIDQELRLHVEPHSVSIATTSKLARRLVREMEGLNCVLDYAYFVVQGVSQEEVAPLHEMTIDFRIILSELVARN